MTDRCLCLNLFGKLPKLIDATINPHASYNTTRSGDREFGQKLDPLKPRFVHCGFGGGLVNHDKNSVVTCPGRGILPVFKVVGRFLAIAQHRHASTDRKGEMAAVIPLAREEKIPWKVQDSSPVQFDRDLVPTKHVHGWVLDRIEQAESMDPAFLDQPPLGLCGKEDHSEDGNRCRDERPSP